MVKRNKATTRILTIGGFVAIGALVIIMVALQIQTGRNNDFKKSIDKIALDVISLTGEYQTEEGKWTKKQYDNSTMISIINQYEPRYQALIDRAKALDTPEKYETARDNLIKSVETEMQSNAHLRSYIETGSEAEYQKVVELSSLSLQYGADYDSAIKAAG
ncbi:MAG TPA: hypothetical protein VJP79_04370 [Nitrososphaera sp.]|nr:hypothetical protein [Nitrososphaera sp.]